MADSDLRRRMGEAARQRVLDVFVWERRVERMLDFYHEVLGGSAINGASSASRTQTGEYRRELRGTS